MCCFLYVCYEIVEIGLDIEYFSNIRIITEQLRNFFNRRVATGDMGVGIMSCGHNIKAVPLWLMLV